MWIGEIAIAAADFPVFAQTHQDWESCKATEADRVSLDQQLHRAGLPESISRPTFSPSPFNYRGYSYHGKAKFACAIQGYSRAIKLMPDYADAYSNRGAD